MGKIIKKKIEEIKGKVKLGDMLKNMKLVLPKNMSEKTKKQE